MAIDPRISLGVQQLQLNDPLTQYGQTQNILAAQAQQRSAGTQNELANVQLGQARMTLQQAQEAHDYVTQVMAKAKENGAPTDDPMEAAMQMLRHPNPQVQAAGGHLLDSAQKVLAYQQQSQFLKDQPPNALAGPTSTDLAPAEAMTAPVSRGTQNNALAPTALPAQQVNAMATSQSLATKINEGDRKYGNAPGWLKQRELLVDEYKQLIKPEFEFKEVSNADGTISVQAINKRTAQAQPVMSSTNQAITGINVPAQKLAHEKEVEQYKRDNPGKTVHTIINDDGTTSMLAVNNKTGVAEKVTLGGVEVKGIDTAAQRLIWQQDHPDKEIKEVTAADGSIKLMAVDKQAGTATPVTSEGKPLVGAKYVTPSEEEKLIKLRDSLPKGSADYNAVNAKVNQAAEQNRIAKANLAIVTRRLNEELAADKGLSDKSIELAANLYLINGTLPPLGSGAKAASAKKQIIDRAAELSGTDSAAAARNIVESKQDVAAQAATVKDFASGEASRKVRANNTALNHLETMDKLAGDLANNDIRIVNAASNAFAKATGSSPPANFDAAKQIVANEVMKAVVANGGTGAEREEAGNNIKSSNSPKQLRDVLNTYRDLLGGQLSSLQLQYETGSGRKDFESKLTPAARDVMKKANPAPAPAGTSTNKVVDFGSLK